MATTTIDIEKFIGEVHARPAIWHMQHADYADKCKRRRAWDEIIDIFMNENESSEERKEMEQFYVTWTLLAAFTVFETRSAVPRYLHPVITNRIINFNVSCDARSFNASIEMEQPFKGLLFAKDFSQECRSTGTLENSVSISLPTSGCGVRLTRQKVENEDSMIYRVTLVAQQDRHLQQISDIERLVECTVRDEVFNIKSQRMMEAIEDRKETENKSQRQGRMKTGDWSNDFDQEYEPQKFMTARAWMEIVPDNNELQLGPLQVGEPALLTVKSTLPEEIGWRVVDCTAHDGLGDSSQKLLDEEGCPMDDSLLPAPIMGPEQQIKFMRHQEATARFSAFKFPDRDKLHVSCGMVLCRGACLELNCDNKTNLNETRLPRTLAKGEPGEILDRLEIFNSVEVIAPGIELDETGTSNADLVMPFGDLPGDRTFCVSPDKMALTFCVLGVIFLVAVVVAALALLKARRNGTSVMPYYTRSLFSSSSGLSAYGGSKLLLQDSPVMGQSSSSQSLPYGRMI